MPALSHFSATEWRVAPAELEPHRVALLCARGLLECRVPIFRRAYQYRLTLAGELALVVLELTGARAMTRPANRTALTLGLLDATDLLTCVNRRIAELELVEKAHRKPYGGLPAERSDHLLRLYRMRVRITDAIHRVEGTGRQGRSAAAS